MTQAERRGAALRAQADAALDFKFAAGQAQDASAYAGMSLRLAQDAQCWTSCSASPSVQCLFDLSRDSAHTETGAAQGLLLC